jgi:hypothetical protein
MTGTGEVLSVDESVARHKAWVAAGEPGHAHSEYLPHREPYCRTCGYTRGAVGHLTRAEQGQPWPAMRAAAQLIRADHGVTSPGWQFWGQIADYLSVWAARAEDDRVGNRWSEFHAALAIGYGYEDTRSGS